MYSQTFGFADEVVAERFWAKVQKTDWCWLWTGKNNGRYGFMDVKPRGRRFRSMAAHRIAYRLLVGPIPAWMTLDHLCRTKLCVRPDHMEVVTLTENGRRSWSKAGAIEQSA